MNNVDVQVKGNGDALSTLATYKTIVLQPNIVDGENRLTQAMLSRANTKYVVKWDYMLREDITMPQNCILYIDGGSIKSDITDESRQPKLTGVQNSYDDHYSLLDMVLPYEACFLNVNVSNFDETSTGGGTGRLAPNAVKTASITDGAVTSTKISDNAVTNAKIDNAAITSRNLSNGAVSREKLSTSLISELNNIYSKDAVYNKTETYSKSQVYNTEETYSKDETYNKNEVYDKAETNALCVGPNSPVVVGPLPVSGTDNTLYRVPNDPVDNKYSEYGWDGTQFILLDIKDYTIDLNFPNVLTDNIPSSKSVYNELSELKPLWNSNIVTGFIPTNDQPPIINTSGGKTCIIPLIGNEVIVIGNPEMTCYYTLLSSISYPNYTLVSGYQNRQQLNPNHTVTLNISNIPTAKYFVVTFNIDELEDTRRPKMFTVNGVDYNAPSLNERVNQKLDTEEFNSIFDTVVGEGISEVNYLPDTGQTAGPGEELGELSYLKVPKGGKVTWNLYSRGDNVSILQISSVFYSGWYEENDPQYPYIIKVVKATDPNIVKLYSGSYLSEDGDCYIKAKGFIPNLVFPDYNSNVTVDESLTAAVKDTLPESNGFVSKFTLGTSSVLLRTTSEETINEQLDNAITQHDSVSSFEDIINQDVYIGFSCIITIKKNIEGIPNSGLYYMYYEGQKSTKVVNDSNKVRGLCFAYSTDGVTWKRSLPPGVDPIVTKTFDNKIIPTNLLFTLVNNPSPTLTLSEWQRPIWGPTVVKVSDPEYPYRLIANEGIYDPNNGTMPNASNYTMYIWKSSDAIHWEQQNIISTNSYDSQFSAVSYGDTIKVYCRLWDYNNTAIYKRQIGVMFLDLDGSILSNATILFGPGLYTSSAFKIDNKRELLLPTYWDSVNDIATYKSYIVDGEKVRESVEVDSSFKEDDDGWGTVNPGFVLVDGDIYVTYTQRKWSHGTDAQNPVGTLTHYGNYWYSISPENHYSVEIRMIPIYWITYGVGNRSKT